MMAKTVDSLDYIGRPEAASAEALLERGYPHIRFLVDDHPDDAPKKVAKATAKAFNVIDPHYHVWWPREVATRYVRGFVEEKRKLRHLRAAQPVDVWSEDEAEAAVARILSNNSELIYTYDAADFVLLTEALVSTDATVRGVVAGIETLMNKPKKDRKSPRTYLATYTVLPLGAMLLRASPDVADDARRRLDAVLDAHPDELSGWPLANVAMLLHGRAGVARAGTVWTGEEAYTFCDDSAYIREGVAGHRGVRSVDARLIWKGGDEVIDLLAKDVRKVRKADADHAAEGLGLFASPRVAPLMLVLASKKSQVARRWWATHANRLRAELEPFTKDKKLGAVAQEILDGAGQSDTSHDDKIDEAAVEKAFDALTDELVLAITKVRGKKAKEKKAWIEAAQGYMDIRSGMLNEEASEYMGHFFMVDGVGLNDARETAWDRLAPNDEEATRWSRYLDDADR